MKIDKLIKTMTARKLEEDAKNIPNSTIIKMEKEIDDQKQSLSSKKFRPNFRPAVAAVMAGVAIIAVTVLSGVFSDSIKFPDIASDSTPNITAQPTPIGNTLDYESAGMQKYDFNPEDIENDPSSFGSKTLNRTYVSTEEMYDDADYVVSGEIVDIEYYYKTDDYFVEETLKVLVTKSYKGDIVEQSYIWMLGNKSYRSYKLYYDLTDGKIVLGFFEKNTLEAFENGDDVLNEDNSYKDFIYNIGDECILFLTYGWEDTYAGKDVFINGPIDETHSRALWSPVGFYMPMGYGQGTFIKKDDEYVCRDVYFVFDSKSETRNKPTKIQGSYDSKYFESLIEGFAKTKEETPIDIKPTVVPKPTTTKEPDLTPIYRTSVFEDLEYLKSRSQYVIEGRVLSSNEYIDEDTGYRFEDIELELTVVYKDGSSLTVGDIIHVMDNSKHEKITEYNYIYNDDGDAPTVDELPYEPRFKVDDICLLYLVDVDSPTFSKREIINNSGTLNSIDIPMDYTLPQGYYMPQGCDMGIFILRNGDVLEQLQYNIVYNVDAPELYFLEENISNFTASNIRGYAER